MLPVLLDMPPSVTCAANSISVKCGESHQVCQLDNSWIPPWYLGYWRSIPGYWLSIRDTGAVSWAVQLLSRMAIELVVERQGREETREHNIDAGEPQRLPRRHGPLAAPCPTALRRVSYVPCLAHVYCAVVSSSVR